MSSRRVLLAHCGLTVELRPASTRTCAKFSSASRPLVIEWREKLPATAIRGAWVPVIPVGQLRRKGRHWCVTPVTKCDDHAIPPSRTPPKTALKLTLKKQAIVDAMCSAANNRSPDRSMDHSPRRQNGTATLPNAAHTARAPARHDQHETAGT